MVQKWKVIRYRGSAAPVLDAPYNPKMTDTGSLATALEEIVGAGHVLTDPDSRSSYETDWTRRYHGTARLVVRPGSTAEVSAVLSLCTEASAAVVPQGGNTGLVGGGVPRGGEVVLSLGRLDLIEPVDTDAAQVTVGAGVTLARLQDHVRDAGFAFGVDLASRGSATIGGMIATNAGGIHVLHYGGMRAQLVGIEAVRADGAILRRLPGLTKDNTGYDLPGLIAGSEGTLAVITAARLKLVSQLPQRAVALLAVPDVASALDILARVRPLASLDAAELFFREGVELVCKHSGLPRRSVLNCLLCPAGVRRPTGPAARARGRSRRRAVRRFGDGRRPRRTRCPLGLPRAPHRGNQRRRRTAQARCRAAPVAPPGVR